jgi:hypothetical protein
MKKTTVVLLAMAACFTSLCASAQQAQWSAIPLNALDAFSNPGKNWALGADVVFNNTSATAFTPVAGTGVVINTVGAANNSHLITNAQFGDVELELEFMMAKEANSGVYLQGRYEVQLFDSWMKLNPTFADCGGIYQRWNDDLPGDNKGYQGIAPLSNVAKAPGLWQKLSIKFHAPKFNANGEKIQNAYFESVYLNGVLIQQQAAVTGPTRAAYFTDEKPEGPLMLQGDHGNVAFRNIRYRALAPATVKENEGDNPITVSADGKPYLLRGFLQYGDKKLTHVISAGYPSQVNYSYDLKQGALIQIWRGQFLDVTDMWHERGEPQLAKPMGALQVLTDAPALAVLGGNDTPWPDSIPFDDFHNKGYVLDASRFATYQYDFNGIDVTDKVAAQPNGLTRQVAVTGAPANLYCRIAAAIKIQDLGNGLYAINDRAYYIQLAEGTRAATRQMPNGKELIVPVAPGAASLTYSIIW